MSERDLPRLTGDMTSNGDRLRAERQRQELSMRELAHFVSCSHATIQRLENGTLDVAPALKARIARALRVPVAELWPHNDVEPAADGLDENSAGVATDAPPYARPTVEAVAENQDVGQAPLLDAGQAGALLNVPKSWVLAEARANRIPHIRLGRYVRFEAAELETWWRPRRRGPSNPQRPTRS